MCKLINLPSDSFNVTVCLIDRRVTYLRVSLVLQVEQAKQLTHQALLRADTTDRNKQKHCHMRCCEAENHVTVVKKI